VRGMNVDGAVLRSSAMNEPTTIPKVLDMHGAYRLGSYLAIWISYLIFMAGHAPRGVDWLSWHLQRIYNAVQYVKVNGYFSSYGFSIWSSCQDCGFTASEWFGNIYLSVSVFKLLPYLFINEFWGFETLKLYGPLIDKLVIFIAAAVAAELIIICVHKYSLLPRYFVGVVSFVLFVTAPWTYKMLLSAWNEIYFLAFFLLGLLYFAHGRNKAGLTMLFLAGFFHYQWALGVAGFYGLLFLGSRYVVRDEQAKQYLPGYGRTAGGMLSIGLVLVAALPLDGVLRWSALQHMERVSGSSLLFRMGISGDDIHNGGLLGALQFLGGNRVTLCLADYGSGVLSNSLTDGIMRYNCFLSVGGMVLLSLLAIVGLVILLKKSVPAKWIVFPLIYALVLFLTILQQSLSVHLMGYSYIFSFLFAAGMVSLMVFFTQFTSSTTLKVVLSIPCLFGISFLAIRVSMLTGANG
jgi:hypothetical protein